MSHANTIQIFHVNPFFLFVWCILFYQEWLVGQHPHAVNRMEYHILDMRNNHEKSLYLDHGAINLLFITFPLRIRNFKCSLLINYKVAIVESPLDYLKTYGYLLAFLGGRDNGLSIGTMNLLRDQDIVLGFQKWLLWEKRTYMEENVNVWRDYFEVKYDIPL